MYNIGGHLLRSREGPHGLFLLDVLGPFERLIELSSAELSFHRDDGPGQAEARAAGCPTLESLIFGGEIHALASLT